MTMVDWQRRGQAAYERALAVPSWFGPGPSWDELPQNGRAAWCAVAEAAFEEGRKAGALQEIEHQGHIHNGYCMLTGCARDA